MKYEGIMRQSIQLTFPIQNMLFALYRNITIHVSVFLFNTI